MPSNALKRFKKKPDIVLGNNHGRSSSNELIDHMRKNFENNGLIVQLNNPYAGGFITRNYGNPSKGIETIQIEVNRSLYMNEEKLLISNLKPLQEIFQRTFQTHLPTLTQTFKGPVGIPMVHMVVSHWLLSTK